jgi:Raf kinase inhibitor-like YbhB/YbcL family protein
MQLTSPAFDNDSLIPTHFTGAGQEISPALAWTGVLGECRSFALICEDIDVPQVSGMEYPMVHWVVYNISPEIRSLPEGLPQSEKLDSVLAYQGINSFGKYGYTGPLPSVGDLAHRYVFTLYALNKHVDLKPGMSRADLYQAMQVHVIQTAKLTGLYEQVATET